MFVAPEADISFEDSKTLQWLYIGQEHTAAWTSESTRFLQDAQWELFSFARQLIPIYTLSITSLSLRYALLAYAGIMTSGGVFDIREERNAEIAQRNLSRRISDRSAPGEGELFAAVLLGLIAPAKTDPLSVELKVHLNGFIAIMRQLIVHRRYSEYSLSKFWPFARDLLFSFRRNGITDEEFCVLYNETREVLGPPSMEQRTVYLGDEVMGMRVSLHYHDKVISRVVRMAVCDSEIYKTTLTIALQDIRTDLNVIRDFLAESQIRTDWDPSYHRSQRLAPSNSIKLPICTILVSLLSAPTIQDGLQDPAVKSEAITLIMMISRVKTNHVLVKVDQPLYKSNLCRRGLGLAVIIFPPGFLSQLSVGEGILLY